jgi:type III secretion protein HrpB1
MSQQMKVYRQMSSDLVGGLVEVVTLALKEARSCYGRVDLDQVRSLLDLLRVFRPHNGAEITFFEGSVHAARASWGEAADVFRSLVDTSKCLPRSRAMLMHALYRAGDQGWREEAERLHGIGDPDIVLMLRSLLASDELDAAIEASGRIGSFQMPESVLEMQRERDHAAPEQSGAAGEQREESGMPRWMKYGLRV